MATQQKKQDYGSVRLPQSQWSQLHRWLGSNVSMTSLMLTELSRLKKTREDGPGKQIPTGIDSIDAMVGGVGPGELLYIGSPQENCNLALGLNMVRNWGNRGTGKLLVFNAGRGAYAYARGLISLCTGIPEAALQSDQALPEDRLTQLEEALDGPWLSDVSVVSTPNISVQQLWQELESLPETERPALVIVDNLRFLTTKDTYKNRQQEQEAIVYRLWKLAKETAIPMVLIGPLTKQRRQMEDYWPTAQDLPVKAQESRLDKIVAVHESEAGLNITVLKNPSGTYGYRKMGYDPTCYALMEILDQGT